MGFENEDALNDLFAAAERVTERAAYQLADDGLDRFEDNVRRLTPVNASPQDASRPPGTLRASWYRVTTPRGSAPPGQIPKGLVKRSLGRATVWRGSIATQDPIVGYVSLGRGITIHNPLHVEEVTLADGKSAPALAYFDAARRLGGEDLPITIPGEKRGFFGKIFGRKAA